VRAWVCVCVITFIMEVGCVLCELQHETGETVRNTSIRIEHGCPGSLPKVGKGTVGQNKELRAASVNGLPYFVTC